MSYLHLLEHWHTHREIAWDPLKIEFDEGCAEDQQLVTLVEALGFELDNLTHPAMEELLRSGRPVCSCGALEPYEDDDSVPSVYIMNVLVRLVFYVRLPCMLIARILSSSFICIPIEVPGKISRP